jgi:predicted metal-dependent HD superfamily phosphohydrolase
MEQSKYQKNVILENCENYIATFYAENISADYVFHDLQHTINVVNASLEIAIGMNLPNEDMEMLQIAAWFHDTGYDQGPEDHEDRSAQYAADYLKKINYPQEKIDKIIECIHATRLPQNPKTTLAQILCDADMSHLGKKIYWSRCGRLREEMSQTRREFMSEEAWLDFEIDFLQKHQFHTDVARILYDQRKDKNIRQLLKQKKRLSTEELNLKYGKKGSESLKKAYELKKIDLGRGVETMYRATYRTHVNLSSIADNKANIMLSVNALIVSIIITRLAPILEENPFMTVPTVILLISCLTAIIFATLSTRPKVTEGTFSRQDILDRKSNLLFFGNFYRMKLEDFHWGMMEMIKDSDFLYSSMTRDLYFLGIVLAKKYRFLRYCYSIFMVGLILSVGLFIIFYLANPSDVAIKEIFESPANIPAETQGQGIIPTDTINKN